MAQRMILLFGYRSQCLHNKLGFSVTPAGSGGLWEAGGPLELLPFSLAKEHEVQVQGDPDSLFWFPVCTHLNINTHTHML